MKTYKITKHLKVTPYADSVRFDIDGVESDPVSADDMAALMDSLITVKLHQHIDVRWSSLTDPRVSMTLKAFHPNNPAAVLHIGETKVDLSGMWMLMKLLTVLTAILPRICEEGVE